MHHHYDLHHSYDVVPSNLRQIGQEKVAENIFSYYDVMNNLLLMLNVDLSAIIMNPTVSYLIFNIELFIFPVNFIQ